MTFLSDTHCHLDFDQYDDDRQAVFERAWRTGVQGILIPAVDICNTSKVLTLAKNDERIFIAVGIHPNSADTWGESSITALRNLAEKPNVCAIGEIGLDYYRERTPPDLQQRILHEQLKLAAVLDKPVIIHCRNAFSDLFNILSKWIERLPAASKHLKGHPGVLHSFGGNIQQARVAVSAGFLLGINGSITFQNAANIRAVVQDVGIDHILLETDAPFITPVPHRGKRNESAYVAYVNDMIAQLLNITTEESAKITYNNARNLFHW